METFLPKFVPQKIQIAWPSNLIELNLKLKCPFVLLNCIKLQLNKNILVAFFKFFCLLLNKKIDRREKSKLVWIKIFTFQSSIDFFWNNFSFMFLKKQFVTLQAMTNDRTNIQAAVSVHPGSVVWVQILPWSMGF